MWDCWVVGPQGRWHGGWGDDWEVQRTWGLCLLERFPGSVVVLERREGLPTMFVIGRQRPAEEPA